MEEYTNNCRVITSEFFECVKARVKFKPFKCRIIPSMYKKALEDFMLFGTITRYPKSKILQWKEFVLYNIALLRAFTDIYGHSSTCPYDEFNDVFFYSQNTEQIEKEVYNYSEYTKILEKYNPHDLLWKNGQWFLSDYGLPILEKYALKLIKTTDIDEILLLINKILNVTHPRSDLAELFIVGGSNSLSFIEI